MADNDQHLKHGKALCGKVFGRFVETFNALVDFMLGLKGDAQGKNGEGHITYDRKNNIIRCDGCCGGGGGGGGGGTVDRSCFRIESRSIEGIGTVRYIVDNYYNVGGVTRVLPEVNLENVVIPGEQVVIYLFLAQGGNVFIESCQLEQLSEVQNNPSNYAFPLYLLSSAGEILTDFRSAPQIQLVEML